jgi:hypothetical protein
MRWTRVPDSLVDLYSAMKRKDNSNPFVSLTTEKPKTQDPVEFCDETAPWETVDAYEAGAPARAYENVNTRARLLQGTASTTFGTWWNRPWTLHSRHRRSRLDGSWVPQDNSCPWIGGLFGHDSLCTAALTSLVMIARTTLNGLTSLASMIFTGTGRGLSTAVGHGDGEWFAQKRDPNRPFRKTTKPSYDGTERTVLQGVTFAPYAPTYHVYSSRQVIDPRLAQHLKMRERARQQQRQQNEFYEMSGPRRR